MYKNWKMKKEDIFGEIKLTSSQLKKIVSMRKKIDDETEEQKRQALIDEKLNYQKLIVEEFEQKKQANQDEYSAVANWCNENGQYTIEEQGEYFAVVEIPEPAEEEKATAIRAMRDNYLKEYVDEYVTNPLRWHDMSEEQQEEIKNYRRYLLDIPEQKEFPNVKVMTFEEWRNQ